MMSLPDPKFLYHLGESTSEILRLFPRQEEFDGLNRRKKGFWYEMLVQSLLDVNDAQYTGNSALYHDWEASQVKGYDISLSLSSLDGKVKRVECKFLLGPIYHSWFVRDWLSRDADIYVTNDVYAVPYACRRELQKKGKKLLSTTEFIMHIQKLTRGNKYRYLNSINCTSNFNPREKELYLNSSIEQSKKQTMKTVLIPLATREQLPVPRKKGLFLTVRTAEKETTVASRLNLKH